jgi:hypothetical protein
MHLAFTGTRKGMTDYQKQQLQDALHQAYLDGYRHIHLGDAVGADFEAAVIASGMGHFYLHAHPSNIHDQRGFFTLYDDVEVEAAPLDRNKDMVDLSTLLIAAPYEMEEQARGGTWYTIRYARSRNIQTTIILPQEPTVS